MEWKMEARFEEDNQLGGKVAVLVGRGNGSLLNSYVVPTWSRFSLTYPAYVDWCRSCFTNSRNRVNRKRLIISTSWPETTTINTPATTQ